MKHKGSTCYFSEQRNKELYKAYKAAVQDTGYISLPAVMEKAVNTPCSRFWVSSRRAAAVLYLLFTGHDVLTAMLPMRREMYAEVFSRAKRVRQQYPTMTILDIAKKVVHSQAPKFYLTTQSAEVILHRYRKKLFPKKCATSIS